MWATMMVTVCAALSRPRVHSSRIRSLPAMLSLVSQNQSVDVRAKAENWAHMDRGDVYACETLSFVANVVVYRLRMIASADPPTTNA